MGLERKGNGEESGTVEEGEWLRRWNCRGRSGMERLDNGGRAAWRM